MKKQLSWKIIQYILGVYIIIGLLITAFQVSIEYEGIKSNLIESMEEISGSFVEPLAVSLWDYNFKGVQKTIKGITSYGTIVGAKVLSDNEDIILYGKIIDDGEVVLAKEEDGKIKKIKSEESPNKLIEHTSDLVSGRDANEKIGTLYLYSSHEFIIDRIKVGASIILLKFILQVIALASVALVTIAWLVSAPLKKLKIASAKINPKSPDFSLDTNFVQDSKLMERYDELGVLAKSLEAARVALLDRDARIQDYSHNLENKVEARTKELNQKNSDIKGILTNIEQGILTFGEDCLIMPEYSSFLERLFERRHLAGVPFIDLIFKDSNISENDLDQLMAALNSIIDDDEIVFELNEHLLIKECLVDIGSNKKVLELEWQPILSAEGFTSKVMLIVKDVTEMRKVKLEAEQQKKELHMIGEILNIGPEKARELISDQIKYLDINEEIIKSRTTVSDESIAILFRNLHTVKGTTRSLGFGGVVDLVHSAEQYYDTLRKDNSCKADKGRMLKELELIKESFGVYERLIEEKIGLKRGLEHTEEFMKAFDEQIAAVPINGEKDIVRVFKRILNTREDFKFIKLDKVIGGIVDSMSSIAANMNKAKPRVHVDSAISVLKDKSALFRDIMAHLFRNSIDHGIETPEARKEKGKNESGDIYLHSRIQGRFAVFDFFDDGSGLNLDVLKNNAKDIELGTDEEVADLIFKSGISTSEKITDISGRGVGMEAVRSFVESEGGSIDIEFTAPKENGFRPFKYVIKFRVEYFKIKTLHVA